MSVASKSSIASYFTPFAKDFQNDEVPERFTFPFYYNPHPLAIKATTLLQQYLESQTEWHHNFGLDPNDQSMAIGKMFGVLVVQSGQELGYLWAFSGKLAESNHFKKFVPPVYDTLKENSFFQNGQIKLNQINAAIDQLESDPEYHQAKLNLQEDKSNAKKAYDILNIAFKESRKQRRAVRDSLKRNNLKKELQLASRKHKQISLEQQADLKYLKRIWSYKVFYGQINVDKFEKKIQALKKNRKDRSNQLQEKIFDQYDFLNQYGDLKNVRSIFLDTIFKKPPSGAGECATPKLLQYAFQNNLKPLAMAEFWWGTSPKSKIRKHKHFYPACRGKCEPILEHMLEGIAMDDNPLAQNPAKGKQLEVIFEDAHLLVINKPAEFLSVPGKVIKDSVWLRIKKQYPNATGPLIVHRLDMSTSGLLVLAKSKEVHKSLQEQFIKRKVTKRYVALLDGIIEEKEGIVDLPLCLDIHNRPQQMVSYENGKEALTRWQVVNRQDKVTRIHFYPESGRTHQLRVHAAHQDGLNTPIIGDDLYGNKGKRLCLHAEELELLHPISKKKMSFQSLAPF